MTNVNGKAYVMNANYAYETMEDTSFAGILLHCRDVLYE